MSALPSGDDGHLDELRQAMYSRTLSEKLVPRVRRTLDLTRPVVGEDFHHAEPGVQGAVVAPRGMGIFRVALWGILGSSIVFFLGAAGFFGYYFLLGGGSLPASPRNVDIVISGPPQVEGGAPAEFQLTVTNRNKVALELADIVITYPPGTRSPADFSTDLPNQRITLGTIEPGGRRQGTVSAVLAGQGGDKQNLKVEVEYHVSGSNSIFVAESDYAINFSSSPLSITVSGNTQGISGQPVSLSVTVGVNGNAPVRDVLLQAEYPFGFKFASAAPQPVSGTLWALGDMTPGQKRTITIQGSLTGGTGDERVFRFSAGTRSDIQRTSLDTVLAESTFRTALSQPFLGLSIAVNESTRPGVVVSPGDKVTIAVQYENTLQTPIQNAIVVARLSGIQIDGSTVKSTDGFFRSADDSVFWDKTTTNGVLADLAPGAKGTLAFSFTMPSGEALKNYTNPRLDVSVNAAGSRMAESGVPEVLQSAARQNISLASDLQLIANGLYYTNPFGSSGPIPPKAGTETTYALVFTVRNTTNKIENGVLTAVLPPYVRWVGVYSPASEKLTFNQSNGTITWQLGDIDPNVGLGDNPPRQAAIAIGFTPSTSQIGQQPALIQNILLKGIDASTTAPIIREVDDITTNIAKVSKSSADINVAGEQGFSASNAAVVK
ncbi:MAG: hypothetical protein RLZZ342_749 [Candidatus Parcubacteria bacterium]|jgi:hypothetical protein